MSFSLFLGHYWSFWVQNSNLKFCFKILHPNSMLSNWCNTWKIKVNELKSTYITFTLRPKDCPEVSFNNSVIPHSREAKYLGLLLDRRLTWGPHLKNKKKQLNSRLHLIRLLLKSNMNLSYCLLLYKSLLQPIWSYGIALCGTAKPSNLQTIQVFQSLCLHMVTKAPWFVTNAALHQDLKVQCINQTAITFYSRLHCKMQGHLNKLISNLHSKYLPGNPTRRLNRNWPRDLI